MTTRGAVFQQVAVQAAPFNNRIDLSGDLPFEDPYRDVPGGQQHPVPNPIPRNVTFPGLRVVFGDRSQHQLHARAVVERHRRATVGHGVAGLGDVSRQLPRSALGRCADQPRRVPRASGPCTLNGVSYASCTTAANLEQRRTLTLENPREGQLLSYVSQYTAIGTQNYRGLKLSFRRRATDSVSLSGNYTLSHCETDTPVSGKFVQFSDGYTDPKNPSYDRGNCPQNRRAIGSFTVGYVTPQFGNTCCAPWRPTGARRAS
jgi:hypothetical protein